MIYDAIIIGGSFAGISAATMLARARRSVLVLDAGSRRNRFAKHSHGVLALDGQPGAEIAATAAAQLALYPTVQQIRCTVLGVERRNETLTVRTDTGADFSARKVLLATGVTDILPDIPGLADRWGRTVFHCPYCHGYEIGGGAIGVLATTSASTAQASTLADWGEVTYFAAADLDFGPSQHESLRRRGVAVDARPVLALEGDLDGPIHLRLADGATTMLKAIFIASRQKPSPLAQTLGSEMDDTPHGLLIRTDANKLTSVPDVYAAGDTARMPSNVMLAAADGVLAGASIHAALIADSVEQGSSPSWRWTQPSSIQDPFDIGWQTRDESHSAR